jgi:hypothetical protein
MLDETDYLYIENIHCTKQHEQLKKKLSNYSTARTSNWIPSANILKYSGPTTITSPCSDCPEK